MENQFIKTLMLGTGLIGGLLVGLCWLVFDFGVLAQHSIFMFVVIFALYFLRLDLVGTILKVFAPLIFTLNGWEYSVWKYSLGASITLYLVLFFIALVGALKAPDGRRTHTSAYLN